MGINPTKLPRFDGIASSPSWHPDGDSIALTISKNGNKDIYIYNLKNQKHEYQKPNAIQYLEIRHPLLLLFSGSFF